MFGHGMSMRQMAAVLVMTALVLTSETRGADPPAKPPLQAVDEAVRADRQAWKELLRTGDYDGLEKTANDLRATNSKYRNGRGRLWRFMWSALAENVDDMEEGDYVRAFESLNAWLKAKPDSVNARLMLAHTWDKYAFFARGGAVAAATPEGQLNAFEERAAEAASYLDDIEQMEKPVDNIYRRLRIDLSRGLGRKPDVNLVYDGIKEDPADMELVHGMTICLLPRWFGEEGELEEFADEVVRRTKGHSGEMLYTTAAIAAKEYVEMHLLETHAFDWPRLQQGFRDQERLYPECREHLDHEAQLAFMADDIEAVHTAMTKIGGKPDPKVWRGVNVDPVRFQDRIKPEMVQGDQARLLLGHTGSIMSLHVFGGDQTAPKGEDAEAGPEAKRGPSAAVVSVNAYGDIRIHDLATGRRIGWLWIDGIYAESAIFDTARGVMAAGSDLGPGLDLYGIASGRSAGLKVSEKKVRELALSPDGSLLAAADQEGTIVVFDLKTGERKHTFPAAKNRDLRGLAFASDGRKLAAVSQHGNLLLCDLEKDEMEPPRKIAGHGLRCLAWTEAHLAIGTAAGEIHVFDGPAEKEVATWKGGAPFEIGSLAFSPDNKRLAIGLRKESWHVPVPQPLYVWSFQGNEPPQPLKGHKLGVSCVRFTNGGKTLVSGSNDWTVRVWDVP